MHSMSICFNSYLLHFSNSILFYLSISFSWRRYLTVTKSEPKIRRIQNQGLHKRGVPLELSVNTDDTPPHTTTCLGYDFAGSIRTPPPLLSSTTIDIRRGGGAVCNTVEFSLRVSSSRSVFRRGEEKLIESLANWDAHLLCGGGDRIDASTRQQKRFNMKIQGIFFLCFCYDRVLTFAFLLHSVTTLW